jgi:hypothetical protein
VAGTPRGRHHGLPADRLAVVRPSPWRALKEGFVYAWSTPHLLATVLLAFLLNFTAFPLTNHLLPVVANNIYRSGQTTLGYMVAAVATGALIGSLLLSRFAHLVSAARMMIVFSVAWYLMLTVFAHVPVPAIGIPVLVLVGLAQSLGLVPAPPCCCAIPTSASAAASWASVRWRFTATCPACSCPARSSRLRLPGDGHVLLRGRHPLHADHSGILARRAVAGGCAHQHEVKPSVIRRCDD